MGLKLAAYRLVARLATALPVAGAPARRRAAARWARWSGGRTMWFHAASVGEALAVEPLMRRLRRARPDLSPVLTFTSASVERWPGPWPAAAADYAPPETPAAVARVFGALKPAVLVFSRS